MSLPHRQRPPGSGQGVPAPVSDAIDALVEAVSAGARPSPSATADDEGRDARSVVTVPSRARRSWIPSRLARWIAPTLLAFAIGVGSTVWTLRTFESFAPQTDTIEVGPTPSAPAAPARAPVAPSPAPGDRLPFVDLRPPAPFARALRPSITTPDLIASRESLVRSEPRGAAAAPTPPSSQQPSGSVPQRANAEAPAAQSSDASSSAVDDDDAPDATALVTSTAAPLPLEATLPVSSASEERPAPESTATRADADVTEETAVLDTVEEYAQALERFDVSATALLWPSVDRRALSRAFGSLKSQDVMFEGCDVALAQSTATARCHGTAEYVAKVGPSSPRTGRYEWLFKLRKRADTWTIEGLSAWPIASASRDQQQ